MKESFRRTKSSRPEGPPARSTYIKLKLFFFLNLYLRIVKFRKKIGQGTNFFDTNFSGLRIFKALRVYFLLGAHCLIYVLKCLIGSTDKIKG